MRRGIRIPQLIPIRSEGAASSSSAPALRELLTPPLGFYDSPAFDFLDRDPCMTYRRHIQVETEEDAAKEFQEPEPGLEPDEPDSEAEAVAPGPPRPTVLNLVQPQDVPGPNPVDGTYMPSPDQHFAAAAQEEDEGDEMEDTGNGPERATRRPLPSGATRGQRALREENARSEPDGVEWRRPYDARFQANMATVSIADVVAVDNLRMVDMWSPS